MTDWGLVSFAVSHLFLLLLVEVVNGTKFYGGLFLLLNVVINAMMLLTMVTGNRN